MDGPRCRGAGDGQEQGQESMDNRTAEQIADELLAKAGIGKSGNGPDALILPPPTAPMAVARCFVRQALIHDDKPDELTLHHWCGCWWLWRATHWVEAEPRTVRAMLWHFTEHAVY